MTEVLLYVAAAEFEAACQVVCLPHGHRASRLHGHSYVGEVRAHLPDDWAPFPGAEVATLTQQLKECVAPLDYAHLNTLIEDPTDENIARWIRQRLSVPNIESTGVQSTVNCGVDIDTLEHAHVWRRYVFQAAHQLPRVPAGHKCGRMHGHGFEVIIHANRNINNAALSVDYDHLDALWAPIQSQLDHNCLNDIAGLENPTSENISAWIWSKLKPQLPELSWVTVYETAQCGAHFDGHHYRIWKEFTVDSAVRLKRAPFSEPKQRIHGHTFTLRLHIHAPLDVVHGWTVDFGDVKTVFDPVFKSIDHQPLYQVMGEQDTDTASIARYIRKIAAPLIPQLDRIDLLEAKGCGVILHWGELGPALPV